MGSFTLGVQQGTSVGGTLRNAVARTLPPAHTHTYITFHPSSERREHGALSGYSWQPEGERWNLETEAALPGLMLALG